MGPGRTDAGDLPGETGRVGCGDQAEIEATEVLKKPEFKLTIDLKIGQGHAAMLTCDFSVDYVKINADYRS